MRISDWSSDVCSSDLDLAGLAVVALQAALARLDRVDLLADFRHRDLQGLRILRLDRRQHALGHRRLRQARERTENAVGEFVEAAAQVPHGVAVDVAVPGLNGTQAGNVPQLVEAGRRRRESTARGLEP